MSFVGKYLTIVEVDQELDGIGYIEGHKIKVPLTNINDVINIKEVNLSKKLPLVTQFSFIDKSSIHATPMCKYYGICGGCKAQHFSSEDYLKYKKQALFNALANAKINCAKNLKVHVSHMLDNPKQSRRRAIFSVHNSTIGFKSYRSNKIVAIGGCPLLRSEINDILMVLRSILDKDHLVLQCTKILVTEIDGHLDLVLYSRSYIDIRVINILKDLINHPLCSSISFCDKNGWMQPVVTKHDIYLNFYHKIKFTSGSFVQATNFGENIMKEKVLSNFKNLKKAIDLFCGSGLFGLNLLQDNNIREVEFVDNVHHVPKIFYDLRHPKIKAIKRDLLKLPLSADYLAKFDGIILNPPRLGALKQMQQISMLVKLPKLAMIYCNLNTFVRDLGVLQTTFAMQVTDITLVDQFVYTPHSEFLLFFNC